MAESAPPARANVFACICQRGYNIGKLRRTTFPNRRRRSGLSWATVLHKRESCRLAFDDWDIAKIASYNESKIAELLSNPGIIRNRLKINATITNAQAALKLGSLADFIRAYVEGKPIRNEWVRMTDVPTKTELSDRICRDMKKRDFKFVGSTIIYSYLQAIGVVNDHIVGCASRL